MKSKILVATIITMVLCLNGCGKIEKPTVMPESTPEVTLAPEAVDSDVQPTEVPEVVGSDAQSTAPPDTTPDVQPEETSKPPVAMQGEYLDVTFDYHYDSYYDQTSMMYGHYNTIQLHTDKYPALAAAVEAYSNARATASQEYLDSLEQMAVEEYAEYGTEWFMGPYVWEGDMFVRRADEQVLSVIEECYDYSGGAHGYSYFNSVNFDVQTGEVIALGDVVKDIDCLPEVLDKELTEKYPEIIFFTEPLSDALDDYVKSENPLYEEFLKFTWTLDYEGVTFYFGNYDIASYVDGMQQVTVLYSEYPHLLEEKYFCSVPSDYVLKLNSGAWRTDTDLDNNGESDYIEVSRIFKTDMYMSDSYSVTVNGNTFELEKYCYSLDTYLVKANDKNYLYVQSTADSDWKSVDVFEITTVSVEYMGSFNGSLEGFTNSLDFSVNKRLDMLSTYDAAGKCYVGEDGMPVAKSGVYTIGWEVIITSTVDISAELVDESGNLSGTTYTFPTGTDFQLMTTDGETYVDVLADDGQRCRFYTAPQWPATVNGMDAESSFEMLWYAG